MKETRFIRENQEKWQRFEKLNGSSEANPEELADLYLDITDDLGYAQTHYFRRTVRVYLNQLGQKVFIGVNKFKRDSFKNLLKQLTISLPLEVYKSRKTLLTALIAFLVYVSIGAVSTALNPDFPRMVLGDSYVDMTIENIQAGNPLKVYEDSDQLAMFINITTNNIAVAFLTFFAGLFFTIGTHLLLFTNGVMLGAFQYYFRLKGLLLTSFLGIWIHGAFEISAIVIAGGAGITAGNGWLFPGSHSRFQSFKLTVKRGFKIMFGLVPFIVAAGFLESYVTHHYDTLPDWSKWFIIAFSFALMLFFFVAYPFYVAKKNPQLLTQEEEHSSSSNCDFVSGKIRSLGELIRDSLFFYQTYFHRFMSLIWKIVLPIALGFIYLRDFLFPQDQDFVYYFDWVSQLQFILGIGFKNGFDYLSCFCWTILIAFIHSSVLFVYSNLTEAPISLISFLKKRFFAIYFTNLIPCFFLFFLPWYAILLLLLLFPFFQLTIPSVSLGVGNWKENLKIGLKYSASNYFISLISFVVIAAIIGVFIQPIAFVGSIVENEVRGPALFPDILDLTAGFIQKITSNYGLNGLFWENIIRQTVYILVLVLIIPIYTILSCLLFSNMQEIKTAKSLQKEFESFGKRDRFKETEIED
jgi:uncharacterized membrane protein SpoIIM required for sporulation